MKSTTLLVPALFVTMAVVSSVCSAQEYPARVVSITVPFTVGGSNDMVARYLANSLGKLWKQTVIVSIVRRGDVAED